jgi:hypothetical protein
MVVMRIQRAVVAAALGMLALTTAACSSGTAVSALGRVCGVTALAGGPRSAVGVKNRALLHVCPSGPQVAIREFQFSIMASDGERYKARIYTDDGWSASVPAGTYRVVGAVGGCPPERPFVVTAGKIRKGVVAWLGCDFM